MLRILHITNRHHGKSQARPPRLRPYRTGVFLTYLLLLRTLASSEISNLVPQYCIHYNMPFRIGKRGRASGQLGRRLTSRVFLSDPDLRRKVASDYSSSASISRNTFIGKIDTNMADIMLYTSIESSLNSNRPNEPHGCCADPGVQADINAA